MPQLGAGIWRADADVDDLGDLQAPFANDAETVAIPVGLGDDVNGDIDAERTGEFERLEVLSQGHALAEPVSPSSSIASTPMKMNSRPRSRHMAEHVLVAE